MGLGLAVWLADETREQAVPHLATWPATKAGGWPLPEDPPCPGKLPARVSMTWGRAVVCMKMHILARSSSSTGGCPFRCSPAWPQTPSWLCLGTMCFHDSSRCLACGPIKACIALIHVMSASTGVPGSSTSSELPCSIASRHQAQGHQMTHH